MARCPPGLVEPGPEPEGGEAAERDTNIPVAPRRQRDLQPLGELLERQPPAKVVLLQPCRRLLPVAIADQRHRRQAYPAQSVGGGPTISQPQGAKARTMLSCHLVLIRPVFHQRSARPSPARRAYGWVVAIVPSWLLRSSDVLHRKRRSSTGSSTSRIAGLRSPGRLVVSPSRARRRLAPAPAHGRACSHHARRRRPERARQLRKRVAGARLGIELERVGRGRLALRGGVRRFLRARAPRTSASRANASACRSTSFSCCGV